MSSKPALALHPALDPLETVPVLVGRPDDRALTEALVKPLYDPTTRGWKMLFTALLAGMGFWVLSLGTTLVVGIGAWGNNIPVAWAFDITNFVWWIGIGHAGTLISAILLLFQQKWRTSINRFAEAMTIFAVMQAAMFPLVHTGRPWFAIYWLFPYPSTMGVWRGRSPLMVERSEWHSPAAFTCTSSSRGPGGSRSTSSIDSGRLLA